MSEDIHAYNQQLVENEKIKARREALKAKMNELNSFRKRKPLSESNVESSSGLPDDKRQCISSGEEDNLFDKKECESELEGQKKTEISNNKTSDRENDVFTSINSKENRSDDRNLAKSTKNNGPRGKSRFAALAATINQWESEEIQALPSYKNQLNDNSTSRKDQNHFPAKVVPRKIPEIEDVNMKAVENPSVQTAKMLLEKREASNLKPVVKTPIKRDHGEINVDVKAKASVWDKAVVATLEAQGFTKSPSASKITYQYPTLNKNKTNECDVKSKVANEPKKNMVTQPTIPVKMQPSDESQAETETTVSDRIAMFSKPKKRKSDVDPALMSLSARVALFEKAMDKPHQSSTPSLLFKNSSTAEMPEKSQVAKQPSALAYHSPKKSDANSASALAYHSPKKSDANSAHEMSPSKASASKLTKHVHQNLMNQVSDNWQNNNISSKLKAEREQELANLRNRWERQSKMDENQLVEESDSQSDANEEEVEVPEEEDNLYDKKDNSSPLRENFGNNQSSNASLENVEEVEENEDFESDLDDDVAEACGEIDKMLDEAMEDKICEKQVYNDEFAAKPGHLYPSLDSMKPPLPPPALAPPSSSSANVVDEKGAEIPLMHTISFYRRQNNANKTPLKKVIRHEVVCSPPSPSGDHNKKQASILQKIKFLQEDINSQQTIISQTSQALNLCRATSEFYGSSEQIEGERLLLIATQKRQACLDEITCLKTEGAMMDVKHKTNYNESEGVLTISDIRLPLKQAFVVAIAEGKHDNFVHNFLCLIKHGPQVIATEMISTQQGALSSGSLTFSNMITVHNLESDFNVIFEVYGLQCPKENISHDRKYHIKKESSKIKLTPKKKQDMKRLTPAISSPGGPLAIRTSSFAIIGYSKLCLKNLSRKVFVLEKVPTTSPLEGNVYMKVKCHADLRADQRGFLTMFEDVSGFGAWHRRWCVLTGQHLAYWKYPNDEKKKEPIGFIDLRRCITGNVTSAPREICARLHTLMMVTMRPLSEDVEENLITQKYDTVTTTKHLLSADSKEEKLWWCENINQALTNIRKWDPQALRPVEQSSNK